MGTTVVTHPLYVINKYDNDEGAQYDWWMTTGDDSEEWFESVAEAVSDVESRLGLDKNIIVLTKAEHDELLDYKFRYEGLTK